MIESKFCTRCKKNVIPEDYSIDMCLLIVLSIITLPLCCVGGIIYILVHAASHERCPYCKNKNLINSIAEPAQEPLHVIHHYVPAANQGPYVSAPNQGPYVSAPNQGPYVSAPNQGPYVSAPNQILNEDILICSNCGAEASAGQFCSYCGSKIK